MAYLYFSIIMSHWRNEEKISGDQQILLDQGSKLPSLLGSGIKNLGKNTGSALRNYTLLRPWNYSYLFRAFRYLWKLPEKLVPSFFLDRCPTWGWNPKSKSVKWSTLRGQFVVQKWFNAPIIPYPSPGPKGWGFQLTSALSWMNTT